MSTVAYGAASFGLIPRSANGSSRSAATCLIALLRPSGKAGTAKSRGLKISLAGAEQKLTQLDERARRAATVNLGLPTFRDIADRTVTATMHRT